MRWSDRGVLGDLRVAGVVSVRVGATCPVRHTVDIQLLIASDEDRAPNMRTDARSGRGRYRRAFEEGGAGEPLAGSAGRARLGRGLDRVDVQSPLAQIP